MRKSVSDFLLDMTSAEFETLRTSQGNDEEFQRFLTSLEKYGQYVVKNRSKMFKWPSNLNLVRHDISAYNALSAKKESDHEYQEFIKLYEDYRKSVLEACDSLPVSRELDQLTGHLVRKFRLEYADAETPVVEKMSERTLLTGRGLAEENELPDVIFVSTYRRTQQTLQGLIRGWPALANVKVVEDRRIIEKDHGLQTIFNDWRLFHVRNPQQMLLEHLQGRYRYRFPGGENIDDIRGRVYQWIGMLIRDYAMKKVLVVTHHLTILSVLAELEQWSDEHFLTVDRDDRPHNCSVTQLVCDPSKGKAGHFKRNFYNKVFY